MITNPYSVTTVLLGFLLGFTILVASLNYRQTEAYHQENQSLKTRIEQLENEVNENYLIFKMDDTCAAQIKNTGKFHQLIEVIK